jgi:hypothetical protein
MGSINHVELPVTQSHNPSVSSLTWLCLTYRAILFPPPSHWNYSFKRMNDYRRLPKKSKNWFSHFSLASNFSLIRQRFYQNKPDRFELWCRMKIYRQSSAASRSGRWILSEDVWVGKIITENGKNRFSCLIARVSLVDGPPLQCHSREFMRFVCWWQRAFSDEKRSSRLQVIVTLWLCEIN